MNSVLLPHRCLITWGLCCAVCAAGLGRSVAAAPSAAKIQRAILNYRSQIKQGAVRIRNVISVDTSAKYDRKEASYLITFVNGNRRLEYSHIEHIAGKDWRFAERRIIRGDEFIYEEVGKTYVPIEIGQVEGSHNVVMNDEAFDPRVVGLVAGPIGVWDQFTLDKALLIFDKEGGTVLVSEVGGGLLELRVARKIDGENHTLVATIDPAKGYGLLNIDAGWGGKTHATTRVKYGDIPGGMWFPIEIQYEEGTDGIVTYRESSTIVPDFATPIADNQFTLASLDLPAGRHVRKHGEHMMWNGAELVPLSVAEAQANLSEGRDPMRIVLLCCSAVVVLFLAIMLAVRWFRRSHAT